MWLYRITNLLSRNSSEYGRAAMNCVPVDGCVNGDIQSFANIICFLVSFDFLSSTFYEDANARDLEMEKNNFGFGARMKIKAVELWNDWNSQIYEYGKEHADGTNFDVLVMRSEDLLDDTYSSLLKLADFVGSPKTPQELCCLSRRGLGDMGGSGTTDGKERFESGGVDPSRFASIKSRFQKSFSDVAQRNLEKPRMVSAANKPNTSAEDSLAQLPGDVGAEGQFFDQGNAIWNEKRGIKLDQAGHVEDKRQEAIHNRRLMEAVEENDDRIPIDFTKKMGVPVKSSSSLVNPRLSREELRQSFHHKPPSAVAQMQQYQALTESRKQKKLQAGLRGSHKRESEGGEVKKRYGKWVKALENYPELSQSLHAKGATALHMFGYEPRQRFMDVQKTPLKCNSRIVC